jgi:CRISPR/Cas system-associated exonuclease Cas4 (RecB family)
MKWNKLYEYPKSMRSVVKDERHYDIGSSKLPSVTTILGATQSDEKRASLEAWKNKVGGIEAERIKNTAATRGTAMHSYLEMHINGENLLDLTIEGLAARGMAQTIIDKGLIELQEIWGNEVVLYYPELYAGQTDLCGVYQGRDSIIDFKQSNKPKKDEWIEDYKLQLAAYATAHDCVYGTKIEQGVILMCTPDNFFQRFIINGAQFREYKWKWLDKVDHYYWLKNNESVT